MTQTVITKYKLVFCEGTDERLFFPRLLKMVKQTSLENKLQFISIDGKNNLDKFLKNISSFSNFPQVKSLGIILDAKGTPNGFSPSLQKAQTALRKIGFPVPNQAARAATAGNKKSVIWIMPNNHDDGEIEALLLQAFAQHRLLPCVDSMANCVGQLGMGTSKPDKSKLYSLLAWLDPPGRKISEMKNRELLSSDLTVFDPLINTFFKQL